MNKRPLSNRHPPWQLLQVSRTKQKGARSFNALFDYQGFALCAHYFIIIIIIAIFIGIPSENLGIRESISANIWLVWLDYSGTPRGEYGHQS